MVCSSAATITNSGPLLARVLSAGTPRKQKLTIFGYSEITVDMSAKKEQHARAKSAGISLEPELKARAASHYKASGFLTMSAYVRKLITDDLKKSGESDLEVAEKKEESGNKKITRAIGNFSKGKRTAG